MTLEDFNWYIDKLYLDDDTPVFCEATGELFQRIVDDMSLKEKTALFAMLLKDEQFAKKVQGLISGSVIPNW